MILFPQNPTIGQQFSTSDGLWYWTGVAWDLSTCEPQLICPTPEVYQIEYFKAEEWDTEIHIGFGDPPTFSLVTVFGKPEDLTTTPPTPANSSEFGTDAHYITDISGFDSFWQSSALFYYKPATTTYDPTQKIAYITTSFDYLIDHFVLGSSAAVGFVIKNKDPEGYSIHGVNVYQDVYASGIYGTWQSSPPTNTFMSNINRDFTSDYGIDPGILKDAQLGLYFAVNANNGAGDVPVFSQIRVRNVKMEVHYFCYEVSPAGLAPIPSSIYT